MKTIHDLREFSSPDEYLQMMYDVCRTEDGKASIAIFLEVRTPRKRLIKLMYR